MRSIKALFMLIFFLPGQCAHLTAFIHSSRPNAVQPFHLITKRTKLSLSCPSSLAIASDKKRAPFYNLESVKCFLFHGVRGWDGLGGRERHGRSADGAQESGLVHVCSLARHQLPPQLGNNGLGKNGY